MPTTYACPSCRVALTTARDAVGLAWACAACGGAALTLAAIRQRAKPYLATALWSRARASDTESARTCPSCARRFKVFDTDEAHARVELDVCVGCQLFWFDGAELQRLGIAWSPEQAGGLPTSEARRAVAHMRLEALRETQQVRDAAGTLRELMEWVLWSLW